MGIKILHLSDIHFNYSGYDTTRMREKIISYVKDTVKTVDLIAVSGDIAYQYGEYSAATEFCTRIKDALNFKDFLVVPGNHDLDRSDISRSLLIKGLNNEISHADILRDNNTKTTLLNAFEKYFVFADEISAVIKRQAAYVVELSKYNVLLLNSALTSYCKDDDGHLDIDVASVETSLKSLKNTNPTIAIGHHTLDCLRSESESKLNNLFRDYNIYVYLCGHSHIMQIDDYLTNTWTIKQLVSGTMIVDNYSNNGFYVIDYCDRYFTANIHMYNIDSECWELCKKYPNSENGLIKCVFTNGASTAAPDVITTKELKTILNSLDMDTKSLIVLLSKYPEYRRFDQLTDSQFEFLSEHQIINDSMKDKVYNGFELSRIGLRIVNLMNDTEKSNCMIHALRTLSKINNNEKTAYYLFLELSRSNSAEAIKIMQDFGRVWLETEGIDTCVNDIMAIHKHTEIIELVYLQGLGELFRGQYQIAKSTFTNGLRLLKEKDNDIRRCFELEAIECDRRLNCFDTVVGALNKFKNADLGLSHWSGVSYELLAHFARQFNLTQESILYYDKAIEIFDRGSAKYDEIEKWHCIYARSMLDNPQPMREPPSGNFLKGLYALSNAKFYAINGQLDNARRYINDGIAYFDVFSSGIYRNRAATMKLLFYLADEGTTAIQDASCKLSKEELALIRNDTDLNIFFQRIDHNNRTNLLDYCATAFAHGKRSKGLSFLALMKKYVGLPDNNCSFDSLYVEIENNEYVIKNGLIDYSSYLDDFNISMLIINYI